MVFEFNGVNIEQREDGGRWKAEDRRNLGFWPALPALVHIPCMQAYSEIIRSGPGALLDRKVPLSG